MLKFDKCYFGYHMRRLYGGVATQYYWVKKFDDFKEWIKTIWEIRGEFSKWYSFIPLLLISTLLIILLIFISVWSFIFDPLFLFLYSWSKGD